MSNEALIRRMNEFFARQAACCEELAREMESLPANAEIETLDRIAERQEAQRARTQALAEEFLGLQAEWNAAHLSEADRAKVRDEAHRAAEAVDRLAALNSRWKIWADEQRAALGGELAGLRRGREAAHKYGVDRDTNASFIDKKA